MTPVYVGPGDEVEYDGREFRVATTFTCKPGWILINYPADQIEVRIADLRAPDGRPVAGFWEPTLDEQVAEPLVLKKRCVGGDGGIRTLDTAINGMVP